MGSKEGLNLGGSNNRMSSQLADFQKNLLAIANILDSVVKPKMAGLESIVGRMSGSLTGVANIFGAVNSGGGNGGGSNVIAASAGNPGGGGVAAGYAAYKIGGAAMAALPSTNLAVQQDFLTNRTRAYGMAGLGNNNLVNAAQNRIAQNGTITDTLDPTRAIIAAQAGGLGGAPNLNRLLAGAATMSNLTPGVGLAGSVEANVAMQQGRNVNMMRAQLGIQLRGPDGSMKSVDKVVDELWNKMRTQQRGGASHVITQQDILISLEPGNSLDSMLNMYFGNDPVLRKQVETGLLVKAATGGNTALADVSKKTLQKLGFSTAAVNSLSNRTAQSAQTLQNTAGASAAGFATANTMAADVSKIANSLPGIADALSYVNSTRNGISGIGGGSLVKILGTLLGGGIGLATGGPLGAIAGMSIAGMITGKASGGPVNDKVPYIVGEKGPELFVPKTDGTIIPNHVIGRAGGGDVSAKGFATKLLQGLGATPTPEAIANVMYWEGKEGGNWNNSAKFNPLNTSYQLPGSKNFDTGKSGSGVQAYKSWNQGLKATINTLTGKSADARGYTDIVNFLKSGGGSNEDFLKLMQASSWDAGKYGGGKSSSLLPNVESFVGNSSGFTQQQILNGATAGAKANAAGNTYNYGGVTVTINGANQSPEAIAKAVKEAMKDPLVNGKVATK
jgi:hypothetical protein